MPFRNLLSARRWLPTGAAILATSTLAVTTAVTVSGFSAQVVNNASTFSSGTMQLEESNGSTTCYSTGTGAGGTVGVNNSANCSINNLVGTLDQVPAGTPLSTTITITNIGSSTAALESLVMGPCAVGPAPDDNGYTGSDTSGFCGKVDFSIGISGKCIYPANANAGCPGLPTAAGTLAAVANTTFTANSTPPLTLLGAGGAQAYTFTVMLDQSATNADQGLQASMTMTWNQS